MFNELRLSDLDIDNSDIVFRYTPSPPGQKYFNQSKLKNFNFQIVLQHDSRLTAMNTIEAIAESLELSNGELVPEDGSFSLVMCQIYTEPAEVSKTDKNLYIWSAMFQAELSKN
ncbi:minor capsid protein [Listeria booriae]|uniref:minor capsid protein n=1 Tax=Listeria booriae TaxID=1552123 RepID=UPI0021AB5D73|nr:minor capsid protein [Listeria booriae]